MLRGSAFGWSTVLVLGGLVLTTSGQVLAQSGGAAGEGGAGGEGGGGSFTCPHGVIPASITGDQTQQGRILRDGEASACPGGEGGAGGAPPGVPDKAYPGLWNPGTTYNYETFRWRNTTSSDACVTVNFDPNAGDDPCEANAHASAYAGSYDPSDQATNYLGDVGLSATRAFSFQVAASTDLVLVVTNTNTQTVCDFALEVLDLPCEQCGNGFVELNEECDDPFAPEACTATCTDVVCGDSIVTEEADEECDDGNTEDDDGCSSSCEIEEPDPTGGTGGNGTGGNGTGGNGTGGSSSGGSGGSSTGGSGGSSSGGSGAGGDAGSGGTSGSSTGDDGGCGCRVAGPVEQRGPLFAALALAFAWMIRRRKLGTFSV